MVPHDASGLPEDPDVEVSGDVATEPRPVHLQLRFLALVFAGGTLGAGVREAIALAFPTPERGIPFAILAVNLAGALLLGLLLEALARRGADRGGRRAARLLVGTGFLGGFTTYSALATDAAALIGQGSVGAGVGYALGTVVLGALATFAGILLGVATHRRDPLVGGAA